MHHPLLKDLVKKKGEKENVMIRKSKNELCGETSRFFRWRERERKSLGKTKSNVFFIPILVFIKFVDLQMAI